MKKAVKDLREHQDHRREIDPDTTEKIEQVLVKLTMMATGITLPFTISLDDPAGNSYVENLCVPEIDPQLKYESYVRSEAEDLVCGLQPDQSHQVPEETPKIMPPRNEGLDAFVNQSDLGKREVIQFPTDCFSCQAPGFTCMCMTDIPHFKEVIIMSFNCEVCGCKSNEIKGGGAVPKQGEQITLFITDLVKSLLL